MGIVLFDRETSCTIKNIINSSLSAQSLFDGYLTEPKSYPHLAKLVHLTENGLNQLKTTLIITFSSNYLFDGYLTKH